jgi:NitT/TauT family transport system substrate-binding protein
MNRSTAITVSASALASVLVPRAIGAQALVPINLGAAFDEDFAEGWYGVDNGMFRDAGLDAKVQALGNGGALTAAVVGGGLDATPTNTGSMAAAFTRGLPLVLIAPIAIYSNTSLTAGVIVPANSPLRSVKDLAGKRMAVTTLHTLYHVSIQNWIDANGGDSTAVSYIELGLPEQLAALQAGRIDAAACVEPWMTAWKGQIRVLGAPYASVAPHFMISGWVANKNWVQNNPATVKKFVSTIPKIATWANTNPKASADVMAKYFHIAPATIESMARTTMGTRLDPAMIQPVIDVVAKYKTIPKSFAASDMFATV